MTVNCKATLPRYKKRVWYNTNVITNILSLQHLIDQYWVTYNSIGRMFVVHREPEGKANMQFKMHSCRLHYFDPQDSSFIFVNTVQETVQENKEDYTKQQIKGAKQARQLYAKLGYPSIKDFRWIIRSNQIQDCPVTTEDVETARKIWGKSIAALKGKTTRSKTTHIAADFVRVPKNILELHQQVYMTFDIFFINQISFFLTLSRKICFTMVKHLMDCKIATIFKAFEEIYTFYH